MNQILIIVVIFIILIIFLYLYCRLSRRGRLFARIPGPPRWPLIGNVHHFNLPRDKLFIYLRTLHKAYGDVIATGSLDVTGIHIYDPNDIETVITKFPNKYKPYTFLRRWLGDGLLISNGNKWQDRRKLLTQAFHFDVLKKYLETFNEETQVFLDAVEKEVRSDRADVNQLMNKTILRIICKAVMGASMKEDIDSVTEKYLASIHRIAAVLIPRLLHILLYIDLTFQLSKQGWEERAAIKDLHRITKDLLIQNQKEGKIDDDGIREEVDTFMFRGFDTTSVATAYLIMSIANDKSIERKLYEEMKSIFGDSHRSAKMDDLKEMKYLECCIKETLRLYPSVHYIVRNITEEIVLGGYLIPEGTICQIQIFDLHRRPDLYPEPERFIPERFLPENCINRHLFAYLPFSAGSRNCIGQKFVILQMKTLISSLIRKYRLEPVTKPSDLKFYVDFVLRAEKPIYVRFHPRKV